MPRNPILQYLISSIKTRIPIGNSPEYKLPKDKPPAETEDNEIVAYYYERRLTTTGDYEWKNKISLTHPEHIENAEYRNLQRLVSVNDSLTKQEPVGYKYAMVGWKNKTVRVTLKDLRDRDLDSISNVVPLTPVPEDIDQGPDPSNPTAKHTHGSIL